MSESFVRRERGRIAAELAVIVVMAVAFLVLFEDRPGYVDALLGLAAVGLIAAGTSRGRTLWALQPRLAAGAGRRRGAAWKETGLFTVPVVVAFFAAALVLGYSDGGWAGAFERVANWHLAAALLLYLPWGLLQQFIFQFFLLGRLLFLLPPAAAIALTAVAFSAVHFPRLPVMAGTLVAGAVWALIYRRHRLLLPLAVSHAVLGATLHYWIFGRDLLASWLPPFGR
ncbi:MAG: CPBP family intramembrane metalloprotease [Gammaproteobacteria bacterium]|nr:CPBP family intramembrane metalloprotease [Gammaproteobacteria bacterium]